MRKSSVPKLIPRTAVAVLALTAVCSAGTAAAAPLTLEPAAPAPVSVAPVDSGGGSIDYAWPFRLIGSSDLDTPAMSCKLSGGYWIPDLGCDHGAPGTRTGSTGS
ncbi:hypothetical protein [Nocardia sp. NPDC056100]|uniref:hypothetical protein n=1 Tax=Nocardia sp. NPDC056100 TaxID=3345712 RepID=UPI0035DE53AB